MPLNLLYCLARCQNMTAIGSFMLILTLLISTATICIDPFARLTVTLYRHYINLLYIVYCIGPLIFISYNLHYNCCSPAFAELIFV